MQDDHSTTASPISFRQHTYPSLPKPYAPTMQFNAPLADNNTFPVLQKHSKMTQNFLRRQDSTFTCGDSDMLFLQQHPGFRYQYRQPLDSLPAPNSQPPLVERHFDNDLDTPYAFDIAEALATQPDPLIVAQSGKDIGDPDPESSSLISLVTEQPIQDPMSFQPPSLSAISVVFQTTPKSGERKQLTTRM